MSKSKRLGASRPVVAVAAFAVGWLAVGVSPTLGYVLNADGCRWAGSSPAIGYRFVDVNTAYQNASVSADTAWDTTSAPGYFYVTTSTSDDDIIVYDNFYPGSGYLAWVSGGCGGDDVWNDPLYFYWNQSNTDPKTAIEKKAIGVHEFGHTYGLSHMTTLDSCDASNSGLMYTYPLTAYSTCGWSTPTSDDVAGATDAHS